MNAINREQLRHIKEAVQNHPALKAWFDTKGFAAFRRFWNLFRTDLMRRHPEEIEAFLKDLDESSKLAEVYNNDVNDKIGRHLLENFFSETEDKDKPDRFRRAQSALITACIEMDAACRVKTFDTEFVDKDEIHRLKERLRLWNLPR